MYNLHHLQTHLLYVNLSFSYTAKQTSILPKDYLGMLEYKREHEAKLIQNIILGIGCILFLLIWCYYSMLHIREEIQRDTISSMCISLHLHRSEAQRCGGEHDALSASLYPFHVYPPCWLPERWHQAQVSNERNHQWHQKGHTGEVYLCFSYCYCAEDCIM